jgi:hypothetical protein
MRTQGFYDQKFTAEKIFLFKNNNLPIPRPPLRTSKLQMKFSALNKEHPTLQNMKFLNFFYFCGSFFALLDPDSEYGSGSGCTDLIESGSNPNPDPKPWTRRGRS